MRVLVNLCTGGRAVTVALLCLLGGCSGAVVDNSGSGNTAAPVVATPTPTPTSTPIAAPISGGTYDTSIGASVDADGFAQLPLRSGAHRYFVNASGSDGNGCSGGQQPTTPLKTIAAAVGCMQNGSGDQVLLAEGSTFNEAMPYIGTGTKDGFSSTYPTVIQSYDPTDPTNESKYGRGDQRNARPVLTAKQGGVSNQGPNYFVIKGLNFNPGNVSDNGLSFSADSLVAHAITYLLIENNIFRYTGLGITQGNQSVGDITASHIILRNNSFYGMWSTGGRAGGVFMSGTSNGTLEDNVFWHCGWNTAVTRSYTGPDISTSPPEYTAWVAAGGPTFFSHSYYLQTNTTGMIVRRNLSADGAGDGGIARGDSTLTENLFIDNPAAIGVGGGPNYNTERPNGVTFDVSYNAIIGSDNLSTPYQMMAWGINTTNGQSGSRVHSNLMVNSLDPSNPGVSGFSNNAAFNQPSYAQYDHNLMYRWVVPTGQVYWPNCGSFPAQCHTTYDYNNWDGAAQGTNTNSASTSFPNPYTPLQLYAALGFADKTAFINYAVNHPEAHIQRNARALLFGGYGVN
jgi:hypothetical protein